MSGKNGGDLQTLEISTRQRDLLLNYGYPFPDTEAVLQQSEAADGIHTVRLGASWINLMLGDLAYSINRTRSRALVEELDELYSVLAAALEGAGYPQA